ncbi:hypothetical protein H9Q69_009691 [Fusarium xylarioides]|nr:hypothetical protein H9Q69_009691 [Fusarium xylarioides]
MNKSRQLPQSPKYDHATDFPSIEVRKQRHFFQIEKNPKDLFFLNATLTIFYRLGRLDAVNEAWRHTHLHIAASYGWADVVGALLSLGSNPDVQDSMGWTALHAACVSVEEGSTEVVQLLLKNGADPNLKADATGSAPIHHLIEASRNAAEPWDCSGKLETLLKGGADINARCKRRWTPIHLASCIPWCNSVFAILYQWGARLDLLNDENRSILHHAALYGDLDHITYLRDEGPIDADPDGKDIDNHTPLQLMAWRLNAKQEELWENMKRPTEEEVKAFHSLIEETRIHRWQNRHDTSYQEANGGISHQRDISRWRPSKPANHSNPREHLVVLPIRQRPNLTPPPSMEHEMQVEERWAY